MFHAKNGKTRLIPAKLNDRKTVAKALKLLTEIVIQMAETWYTCHRKSGWVNLEVVEKFYKQAITNSSFVYSDNPKFTVDDNPESQSIKEGYRFPAQYYDKFLSENRPNA